MIKRMTDEEKITWVNSAGEKITARILPILGKEKWDAVEQASRLNVMRQIRDRHTNIIKMNPTPGDYATYLLSLVMEIEAELAELEKGK